MSEVVHTFNYMKIGQSVVWQDGNRRRVFVVTFCHPNPDGSADYVLKELP